jgi:hypothetical protein
MLCHTEGTAQHATPFCREKQHTIHKAAEAKHSEYTVGAYGLSQMKGELSGDKYGRKEILAHCIVFAALCVAGT